MKNRSEPTVWIRERRYAHDLWNSLTFAERIKFIGKVNRQILSEIPDFSPLWDTRLFSTLRWERLPDKLKDNIEYYVYALNLAENPHIPSRRKARDMWNEMSEWSDRLDFLKKANEKVADDFEYFEALSIDDMLEISMISMKWEQLPDMLRDMIEYYVNQTLGPPENPTVKDADDTITKMATPALMQEIRTLMDVEGEMISKDEYEKAYPTIYDAFDEIVNRWDEGLEGYRQFGTNIKDILIALGNVVDVTDSQIQSTGKGYWFKHKGRKWQFEKSNPFGIPDSDKIVVSVKARRLAHDLWDSMTVHKRYNVLLDLCNKNPHYITSPLYIDMESRYNWESLTDVTKKALTIYFQEIPEPSDERDEIPDWWGGDDDELALYNPDYCDVCGEPMSSRGYCYKCDTGGHPTFYQPGSYYPSTASPIGKLRAKKEKIAPPEPILLDELNRMDEYIRTTLLNLNEDDAKSISDAWKQIMNRQGTKIEFDIVQAYLDGIPEDDYKTEIKEVWQRLVNARRLLRKYENPQENPEIVQRRRLAHNLWDRWNKNRRQHLLYYLFDLNRIADVSSIEYLSTRNWENLPDTIKDVLSSKDGQNMLVRASYCYPYPTNNPMIIPIEDRRIARQVWMKWGIRKRKLFIDALKESLAKGSHTETLKLLDETGIKEHQNWTELSDDAKDLLTQKYYNLVWYEQFGKVIPFPS